MRGALGEQVRYIVRALKERDLGSAPKDNFIAISPELTSMAHVRRWMTLMAVRYPEARHFRVVEYPTGQQTWHRRPNKKTLARVAK